MRNSSSYSSGARPMVQATGFLAVTLFIIMAASLAHAGEVLSRPSAHPDPDAKYLFYMHGRHVERQGVNEGYDYPEILASLATRGLIVIGEVRRDTDPRAYSTTIVRQVRGLLTAGVPAKHITVAGHSRGGFMSMLVAAQLRNDAIRFGVLAGCGAERSEFRRSYMKFAERRARAIQGKFLIAWDEDDDVARSCDEAMKAGGVVFRNLVFRTGKGHRLFYRPDPIWIEPLIAFALTD
jgi:hypothetical protein